MDKSYAWHEEPCFVWNFRCCLLNIREVEDLEWYGFDPYAPRPHDDGLSTVELDDVDIDNEDDVITIKK